MSNVLNIYWSESNDQKNRYHFTFFFITISLSFLIPRFKYMLYNITQSWEISGYVSWQITALNNSYSSMNSQQMSIYPIENMIEYRLKSYLMNINDWNVIKDDHRIDDSKKYGIIYYRFVETIRKLLVWLDEWPKNNLCFLSRYRPTIEWRNSDGLVTHIACPIGLLTGLT